mmetsp:Transcript_24231/g.57344  ORF Transcript_24231/g.57344 Transcript_24231/m.57344 type:complete len:860 (+) Transcript_24231:406-2985(+)
MMVVVVARSRTSIIATTMLLGIIVAVSTVTVAAEVDGAAPAGLPTTVSSSSSSSSLLLTDMENSNNNNIGDFFNSFSTTMKIEEEEEKHQRSLLSSSFLAGSQHHHDDDDIDAFFDSLMKMNDVEQFVRSLQQPQQQQQQQQQQQKRSANVGSGGFGTRSSYLDVKLRGSGLFDDNNGGSTSSSSNYNDMALPRSYGQRSGGPDQDESEEHTEESLTRSYGSDGGGGGSGGKKMKKTKKGGPKEKHGKREKAAKKKIDKKLAVNGDFNEWVEPYEDDGAEEESDSRNWHFDEWAWEYGDEEEIDVQRTYADDDPTMSPAPTATPYPTGTGYTEEEFAVLGRTGMRSRIGDDALSSENDQSTEVDVDEEEYGIQFSFPTIQHMIYSGSIHLKAHSISDLSALDPEIFAVLEAQLTPYLQGIIGHTLQAYSLEVVYTPGFAEDQSSVAPGIIVTNMEVTCTLKVRSDSVISFKRITHQQANQWVRDFFGGSDLTQFLFELMNNNIPVNEIVFIEDDFKTSGQVVAAIASGGGNYGGKSQPADSGSNTGLVVGLTLAILAVGGVLFLHLTGNLPSREEMGDMKASLISSLHLDRGNSSRGPDDDEDETELERKARKRRGIRKAAIQKHPAYSDDYISVGSKSLASKRSASSGARTGSTPSSSPKSVHTSADSRNVGYDDYSFSVAGDYNIGGDYGSAVPSPGTPGRRSNYPMGSRRYESPKSATTYRTKDDEFSMPADYDTVVDGDAESLYSKWTAASQSVMSFMPGRKKNKNKSVMSPPPGSPRRVTPSDLGSRRHHAPAAAADGTVVTSGDAGTAMDAWSVESFDTKSPSTSGMYREWDVKSPTSRSSSKRSKLIIPSFN